MVERADELRQSWFAEALPSIAAAMAVAIEVLDTFGPGYTTVKVEIDAELWNNKYFVWKDEFIDGNVSY